MAASQLSVAELKERVGKVAEKLQLKAKEAEARGNEAAAHSLQQSVQDLMAAATRLSWQEELLSAAQGAQLRLRVNEHDKQNEDLQVKLARVEKMLLKKSEEMKRKGNDSASQALAQAAASVAQGCHFMHVLLHANHALHDQLGARADEEDPASAELWAQTISEAFPTLTTPEACVAQLRQAEQEQHKLLVQNNELTGRCDTLEVQLEAFEQRLEAGVKEAVAHSASEWATKLAAAREQVEQLHAAHEEKLMSIAQEKASTEQELRDLLALEREKYEEARKLRDTEDLERVIDEQRIELDKMKEQVLDLENQLRYASDEQVAVHDQMRSLESTLNDERSRHETAEMEKQGLIDKFEAELRELRDAQGHSSHEFQDTEALQQEVKQLRDQLAAIEDSSKLPTTDTSKSPDLIDSASTDVELNEKINEMQVRYESTYAELESLRSELKAQQSQHDQREVKLKAEIDALQAQSTAEREELACLRQERDALLGRCNEAAAVQTELQDEITKLEAIIIEKKDEIVAQEKKIQHLQQCCLEARAVQDEQRNLEDLTQEIKRMQQIWRARMESESDSATADIGVSIRNEDLRILADNVEFIISSKEEQVKQAHTQLGDFVDRVKSVFVKALGAMRTEDESDTSQAGDKLSCILALGERMCILIENHIVESDRLQEQIELEESKLNAVQTELQKRISEHSEMQTKLTCERDQLQEQCSYLEQKLESAHKDENTLIISREEELQSARDELHRIENEFEKYRHRSHAALRKVEKRAQMLNPMKREKEKLELSLQDKERKEEQLLREVASARLHIQELHELRLMVQEEYDLKVAHERECSDHAQRRANDEKNASNQLRRDLEDAQRRLHSLEEEKRVIASSKNEMYEQRLAERDLKLKHAAGELEQSSENVRALQAENEQLFSRISSLEAELEEQLNSIRSLRRDDEQQSSSLGNGKITSESGTKTDDNDISTQRIAKLVEENTELHAMVNTLKGQLGVKDEANYTLSETTSSGFGSESMCKKEAHSETALKSLESELAIVKEENEQVKKELDAYRAKMGYVRNDEEPTQQNTKDNLIRDLRNQVKYLTDELAGYHDAAQREQQETDKEALRDVMDKRKQLQMELAEQSKKDKAAKLALRFDVSVKSSIAKLHEILELHSTAYKEACFVRNEVSGQADTAASEDDDTSHASATKRRSRSGHAFEEYLVMKSGVVIKAGTTFSLPVVCDQVGWRVVWKFAVKEDGADVGFTLKKQSDADESESIVVVPQRVNELQGVFIVSESNTRLFFEWDNTFSWLNEKTLDYHVSVMEPLSPEKKEKHLQVLKEKQSASDVKKAIEHLSQEVDLRQQLRDATTHLSQLEDECTAYVSQLQERQTEIQAQKKELQATMESTKAKLSVVLHEQEQLEDWIKQIQLSWEAAVTERDDARTTLSLSEGCGFEELIESLQELNAENTI